jgi:hypothetical protein
VVVLEGFLFFQYIYDKCFEKLISVQEQELEQKTGIEANMDEDIRSIEEVLQEVGNTRKQS